MKKTVFLVALVLFAVPAFAAKPAPKPKKPNPCVNACVKKFRAEIARCQTEIPCRKIAAKSLKECQKPCA